MRSLTTGRRILMWFSWNTTTGRDPQTCLPQHHQFSESTISSFKVHALAMRCRITCTVYVIMFLAYSLSTRTNQASCYEPCCGLWCRRVEIFYWWWPFSSRYFGPCRACPWPLASEVTPATNCNHVTCTCIRHQLRTRSLMLQYGLAPICQLQHSHVNSWQILRRDKIYA